MSKTRSVVFEKRWSSEAAKHGWVWLEQLVSDKKSSIYHHLCGHVQKLRMEAVLTGKVSCTRCSDAITEGKWSEEASRCGLTWVARIDKHKSMYRHSCGNTQSFRMGDVRNGQMQCSKCWFDKIKSEAQLQGWVWERQIDGGHSLYVHACGHLQVHGTGNMRFGRVACHGCGESWATKPSNTYLLRITVDETCFLKLGISKDVGTRACNYGLPDRAKVEIVRTIAYDTGKEAIRHEKRIHKTITENPAVNRFDPSYWMENGHTECYVYSKEAENALSHAMFVESLPEWLR